MLEVVFSVPIIGEPVSGDSKLLALFRLQDKSNTLIKSSWLQELDQENRRAVFQNEVILWSFDEHEVLLVETYDREIAGRGIEFYTHGERLAPAAGTKALRLPIDSFYYLKERGGKETFHASYLRACANGSIYKHCP